MSLTKQEHIEHWVYTAEKDWGAAKNLVKSKNYVQALFLSHLYLEKLCKALWVKNNKENHPPRVHNLVHILKEAKVKCTDEQLDFALIVNNFQMEGRYPDYTQRIYKLYKEKNTKDIVKQVKVFGKWLQEQL